MEFAVCCVCLIIYIIHIYIHTIMYISYIICHIYIYLYNLPSTNRGFFSSVLMFVGGFRSFYLQVSFRRTEVEGNQSTDVFSERSASHVGLSVGKRRH